MILEELAYMQTVLYAGDFAAEHFIFQSWMVFRRISLAVYPAAIYAAIIPAIFIMS